MIQRMLPVLFVAWILARAMGLQAFTLRGRRSTARFRPTLARSGMQCHLATYGDSTLGGTSAG